MIVEGNAYWASLVAPNTTYEPMYTINVVVDEATAKDFAERGHSIREMEEGPAVVIKRKVNGPNGMVRKAPRLLDADKNDVDVNINIVLVCIQKSRCFSDHTIRTIYFPLDNDSRTFFHFSYAMSTFCKVFGSRFINNNVDGVHRFISCIRCYKRSPIRITFYYHIILH